MNLATKHSAELARHIRNRRFSRTDAGVLVQAMGIFLGGAMRVRDYRDNSEEVAAFDANTLTDEGLNHFLNAAIPPSGGYTPITQWYIAPYSGNYTPDGTLTGANFNNLATEHTNYTNGTRLAMTVAAAATAKTTGNTGNEALMTLNGTGPYDIYGAAILSASAKSATTGKCLACVRFDNPRLDMLTGDKLGFEYIITAADVG